MTNQADTAVNKELDQELEGEGSAETQPIEASDAAEVSLEASEQAEDSAAETAPVDEPVASTAESGDEATAEAVAEESSAPEAVEPVASAEEEPVASVDEEPVTSADEEPVASVDEEPAASVDEEPVASVDEEPAASVDEEPVASADEEPAASVDEEPAASTEEEPVASTEEEPAVPALSADDEDTEVIVKDDGSTQVVRMLAVGQQVDGVVKRITDFGAFVDIGVGRDGLIHISELSTRRVAKVSDVLSDGQAVTPWIKKLDRQRNRISLTLIDPEMKTIRDLEAGDIVEGTVSRILPYGAFVDIGIGRDALLHVREMGEGFVAKPEDVVQVGEKIEARIIELSRRRGRVDLSLKGLREEPAPVAAAPEAQPEEQAADEPVDQFEEIEVLSPMELAFKKAMEAEGIELNVSRRRQGKRGRRAHSRSIQDEIIARTLDSAKK